jgi:hypothetical protein
VFFWNNKFLELLRELIVEKSVDVVVVMTFYDKYYDCVGKFVSFFLCNFLDFPHELIIVANDLFKV